MAAESRLFGFVYNVLQNLLDHTIGHRAARHDGACSVEALPCSGNLCSYPGTIAATSYRVQPSGYAPKAILSSEWLRSPGTTLICACSHLVGQAATLGSTTSQRSAVMRTRASFGRLPLESYNCRRALQSCSVFGMSMGRTEEERSVEGKVALVTGASSGMGFETVVGLLNRGAHVVATCRSFCLGPLVCLLSELK